MKPIKPHSATHRQIQKTILKGIKDLPLPDRIIQGVIIALQATCRACIAYGIGFLVHPQQAVWAAMTAIAVSQHDYADTIYLSRDQFTGAMVGGLLGFIGASLGSAHPVTSYAITV